MNLLPHEKAMLYSTYLQIAFAKTELMDAFYQRLFEIDPKLELLLVGSKQDLTVKWRLMLIASISTLDQPLEMKQSLRKLGKRHLDSGVKREDFLKFIDAFVGALHQYLGGQFTPEMEATWRKFLYIITAYINYENPHEGE